MMPARRFFIVGGAGFIGSHFVDRLLSDSATVQVTVFDNFSSGRMGHIELHARDKRLRVVRGDVKELEPLTEAMGDHDVVIHLASNPDVARAVHEPQVDFWEGTYLTQNVVEAMRRSTPKRILYASGSGVYGDLGLYEADEDFGPLVPISTYGASKLAGEALIASYCHMFGLTARVFRFGNVVGPQQTHRSRLRLCSPAQPKPRGARNSRRRDAEQVVYPRRRRDERCAARPRTRSGHLLSLQRGDR